MVTINGGVGNLISATEDVLVAITAEDIDTAVGLDAGKCPCGNALKRLDPTSRWIVSPTAVCRYSPEGDFAYDLPAEAIEFLESWDRWYVINKIKRAKATFPTRSFEFEMAPAKYPKEHLVSSMSVVKV